MKGVSPGLDAARRRLAAASPHHNSGRKQSATHVTQRAVAIRATFDKRRAARAASPPKMDKRCPRCGDVKPLSEFYKQHLGGGCYCKACWNIYCRDSNRAANANGLCGVHREPVVHGTVCPRCVQNSRNHLLRKYGITDEQYRDMLAAQGGGCAICGKIKDTRHGRIGIIRRLQIDHDHETGRIRGILCTNCNNGLGRAKDNPERLRAMAEYLDPTPEWIGACG